MRSLTPAPPSKGSWMAQVGSVFSAGLVGFCPVCIPSLGAFLAAIGLGFLVNESVLKPLLLILLLLTLSGLFWSFWKDHRKPYPLAAGIIMATSLYVGRYVYLESNLNTLLMYGGIAGIVGASIWNLVLRKKYGCRTCQTESTS